MNEVTEDTDENQKFFIDEDIVYHQDQTLTNTKGKVLLRQLSVKSYHENFKCFFVGKVNLIPR